MRFRSNWRSGCLCATLLLFVALVEPVPAQEARPGSPDGHVADHDPHEHSHDHPDAGTAPHAAEEQAEQTKPSHLFNVLAVYSIFIAAASLLGGWLPGHVKLSHLRFQLLLSLIGGLLLGIGVFHLFPHAVHELGPRQIDEVAYWMMAGIVLMFLLLRTLHVHHHEPALEPDPDVVGLAAAPPLAEVHPDHQNSHTSGEPCSHGHDHGHDHHSHVSWAGLFFGLAVHTLLDGLALGASMQADASHGVGMFVGLGILLAIVLHKPLDSLSITTLMINGGCSRNSQRIANLVYASLCPLGAAAFLLGVGILGETGHRVVGCSLALSAGVFMCIALADLLPEMEFHSHNRWRLSAALMLGISLAWAIQFLEPAHLHH